MRSYNSHFLNGEKLLEEYHRTSYPPYHDNLPPTVGLHSTPNDNQYLLKPPQDLYAKYLCIVLVYLIYHKIKLNLSSFHAGPICSDQIRRIAQGTLSILSFL